MRASVIAPLAFGPGGDADEDDCEILWRYVRALHAAALSDSLRDASDLRARLMVARFAAPAP